jgi:hypothetical protein
MNKKWLMLPIGLLAVVVVAYVGGHLVRLLWNWLLPSLFGVPEVTYWQALGLLALSRILVGGFGLGGGGHHSDGKGKARQRFADRMADRMVDRFVERWDQMTPEERERIRQWILERCGFDPAGGDRPASV